MGWASGHIAKLQAGETVSFRPRGNSMAPRIASGQLCTVAPVDPASLEVGDIVLCRVRGAEYLHLVKAIQGERYQSDFALRSAHRSANNRGRINGWIGARGIFGRLVALE